MKKIAGVILFLTLLLFLPSCVEVIYEIKVDENDLEHLTMRMGMPSLLAPYMGEIITQVQNEGFFVKTDTQGDKVWIVGDKKYEKGMWDMPALPSSVTITSITRDTFQVDDYLVFKKYILDIEYGYRKNNANGSNTYDDSLFSVPVRFVVTFPGTVHETNAHERQGEAAVWNYVIVQNGTIAMKLVTYKIRWGLISLLCISFTAFIGAVVFLAVRSSRSRPAPQRVVSRPHTPPANAGVITPARPRTETSASSPPPAAVVRPEVTRPPAPAAERTIYIVTLSLPPDLARAEKTIRALAANKKKTPEEIIAELKSGNVTVRFSDKALLEKNLAVLKNAGFDPKVTITKK